MPPRNFIDATVSTYGEPDPTVRTTVLDLLLMIPQPVRIVIELAIGFVLIWAVKS